MRFTPIVQPLAKFAEDDLERSVSWVLQTVTEVQQMVSRKRKPRESFLKFSPPDIGEEEINEVIECLRSGWITTGPRVARFEEEFAAYVGAEAALALNSGTGALHTGLLALGIGAGDAVVVPTMTFSSSAHTVEHVGARVILADCDEETLGMSATALEPLLEAREVRCIAPVHLHGLPCDMPGLIEAAQAHSVAIVDDAAHALPAAVATQRIGGFRSSTSPVLTAFSFYATKNLTTGEGGMLTGTREMVEEARAWSLHGMTRDAWGRYDEGGSWRYDVTRPGFKYNMSDIQAALGLVQLRRLDAMHQRRRDIAGRYAAAFSEREELDLPAEPTGVQHAWHIYALRLRLEMLSIDRDRFITELARRNIGTSVHFIPLHLLSYYRDKYGFAPDDFPVATSEFQRLVSLPLNTRLEDEDVDDVVDAVFDVLDRHRR